MSPLAENDEIPYYDDDDDDDDGFKDDIEALRRACMITGQDPDDIIAKNDERNPRNDDVVDVGPSSDSDFDEDLELLRKIKSQFADTSLKKPLSVKPLCTLLPPSVSDEEEDDYQTLLAVRKRFAAYENDTQEKNAEKSVEETCNEVSGTEAHERFPYLVNDKEEGQPSGSIEWNQSDSIEPYMSPTKSSGFPKSALAFWDAIIKNRSYQKFLQSKLIQIQGKIEENNKLKQRVKILRDFQAHCKRRTGEALSQKKDPRVQLILTKRPRADSKTHDRAISALSYGPEENPHVADYRKALTKFPVSLDRKNWSDAEKKDLQKGIRQQFQERVLQSSIDESSYSETRHGDSNDIDNILASIKDLEITPYSIREFLPKVNWEQLASMYVPGRSGGECEARWLNWEDPLVNHGPWTTDEDKMILYLVQKNGVNDWINIAEAIGTNRTPFQCLARYQRSLNASILKREWTKDEDAQLSSAVEAFGERDWQSVASALNGRTGTQCSNRWKKSLHPTRTRAGKWTPEEDKRLIVAQMLFGSKNWNKTAQFVPGRTQAQCRDRYVNSLEPSLKWCEWTEEEDSRLIAAIEECGHCWSKVAAFVPHRTDNMCWRRWKVLFPDEVPLLREEKKIRKTALIRNFVDREKERPALGPNDFLLQDGTSRMSLTYPRKTGGLSRVPKTIKPRRQRNNAQLCSEEEPGTSNTEVETYEGDDASKKKKKKNVLKQRQRRQKNNEPTGESEAAAPVPKKNGPRRNRNNGQIPGVSHSEVRTCDGDDAMKKKKIFIQRHRRHKGTELTGECNALVPVSNEDDALKEPTEKSCSDQIIGTSDEERAVSNLLRKSKKRKLEVADDAVQEYHSCTRDREVLMQHEPAIASNNKPGRRKLVSGHKLGLQEPMKGVSGIIPGSDNDTDNPVLPSMGKKKYTKRHAQTTKGHVIDNDHVAGEVPKQEARIKSGKEQASSTADSGDDMTLNCFLRNRSKKRRKSGT